MGVDFIARAIQEARVDEDDPFLGGLNASFQVNRSAAFLVHDADLQGVRRQPQHRFNAGEEVHGKGHLLRPMLLGLDDVYAARAAVAQGPRPLQVVYGGQRCDHAVHKGFRDRFPGVRSHHFRHDVGAHISHQQEAAAVKGEVTALGGLVASVRVHAPLERFPALVEGDGKGALHDAAPVAVDLHLVGRVHGGDGILAVHDGADGRFEGDVLNASLMLRTDGVARVDEQIGVEAVVLKEHLGEAVAVPVEAHEGVAVGEGRGALSARELKLPAVHGEAFYPRPAPGG